jgi:hypothetical protein
MSAYCGEGAACLPRSMTRGAEVAGRAMIEGFVVSILATAWRIAREADRVVVGL